MEYDYYKLGDYIDRWFKIVKKKIKIFVDFSFFCLRVI